MGHEYALEVESNDIDDCCEKLKDYFHEIDAKEVPPLDSSKSAYTTVMKHASEESDDTTQQESLEDDDL